jgi:hypothetical protein
MSVVSVLSLCITFTVKARCASDLLAIIRRHPKGIPHQEIILFSPAIHDVELVNQSLSFLRDIKQAKNDGEMWFLGDEFVPGFVEGHAVYRRTASYRPREPLEHYNPTRVDQCAEHYNLTRIEHCAADLLKLIRQNPDGITRLNIILLSPMIYHVELINQSLEYLQLTHRAKKDIIAHVEVWYVCPHDEWLQYLHQKCIDWTGSAYTEDR